MKYNTDKFIEKAREIHGDKYDYSKVDYKNGKEKVCIICPKHGEFWQTPKSHIFDKHGCAKCGKESELEKRKVTTDDFINKAIKVHGNRYDYSKVNYQGSEIPITIICPVHGEFQQTPHRHLRGDSCPKCSSKAQWNTKKFIEKAREIHGNKYDYSKVDYKDNASKVCIICPEHGEFWQSPKSHIEGSGCKKCGAITTGLKKRGTLDDFIIRAQKIHNNKYDYSDVNWVKTTEPIKIICPVHGEFWQSPHKHLSGHGCPDCGSKNNITELNTLNILKEEFGKVEYQKIFPFLRRGSGVQKLDFYLPMYNVAIELQGRQHFEAVNLFGGEEELEKTQRRDLKKYNDCISNGIKIYYYAPKVKKSLLADYFEKVYTSLDDLIADIKNSSKVTLNEEDIKKITEEIIKKIKNLL